MAINATPGAADANSYATLAEAADYIGTLTFAEDWPADPAAQEKVLRQAAMIMETLDYKGQRAKSEAAQALAFPRWNIFDRAGYYIDSATIPALVKRAQIQLALALAGEDRTVDAGGLAPDTLQVGTINLGQMRHRPVPSFVLDILAPFLASTPQLHSAGAGMSLDTLTLNQVANAYKLLKAASGVLSRSNQGVVDPATGEPISHTDLNCPTRCRIDASSPKTLGFKFSEGLVQGGGHSGFHPGQGIDLHAPVRRHPHAQIVALRGH